MNEPNFRLLALDPGGTTGWSLYSAVVRPGENLPGGVSDERWAEGHLGPGEHHQELYQLLGMMQVEYYHTVTESFEFRQGTVRRTGLDLSSKEYIGVYKLWCKENGLPVVQQTAGAAKGFVSDDKLKAMGLWVPGMKHAMDARRHAVTFLVQKLKRTDLVQSWRNLT